MNLTLHSQFSDRSGPRQKIAKTDPQTAKGGPKHRPHCLAEHFSEVAKIDEKIGFLGFS